MAAHQPLPQLTRQTFITDGGMETDLIFHAGFELPHFAAFVLLDDERGWRRCATITGRTSRSPASTRSA